MTWSAQSMKESFTTSVRDVLNAARLSAILAAIVPLTPAAIRVRPAPVQWQPIGSRACKNSGDEVIAAGALYDIRQVPRWWAAGHKARTCAAACPADHDG